MTSRSRLRFADAQQILAIAAVAFEALQAYAVATEHFHSKSAPERARLNADWEVAMEALRFCAAAAGAAGDATLAPLLGDIANEIVRWSEDSVSPRAVVASAVKMLLERGAEIDGGVEELAEHGESYVRDAVASGLSPSGAAVPVLEKLARDPNADVRKAARAKLASVREIAWWMGVFAADPLARLSPAEGERHRDALEKAATAMSTGALAELAEALRDLPDAFALEAAEAALAELRGAQQDGSRVAAVLLGRPGAEAVLVRLCRRWAGDHRDRHNSEELIRRASQGLPKKQRIALGVALARAAAAAPPGPERAYEAPASLIARIAAIVFPAGAGVGPILDVVLGMACDEELAEVDYLVYALAEPLRADGANFRGVFGRLLEARLAGWTGAARLMQLPDKVLARAPKGLFRRAVEQGLLSDRDEVATWALEQLVGPAHDARRDPTRAALIRRFWAESRPRLLIGRSHALAKLALPYLRADLRAGRLELAAAFNALRWIASYWGGVADVVVFAFDAERETDPEIARSKARKGMRDVLGPKSLQGPPTEGEWEAYRAARAASPPRERSAWREQMSLFPPGPWHPADRALLDAAVARAREGDGNLPWLAAMALAGKPFLEDAALMDELVTLENEDHFVSEQRQRFRDKLGLPREEDTESPQSEAHGAPREQWMDRDDDD